MLTELTSSWLPLDASGILLIGFVSVAATTKAMRNLPGINKFFNFKASQTTNLVTQHHSSPPVGNPVKQKTFTIDDINNAQDFDEVLLNLLPQYDDQKLKALIQPLMTATDNLQKQLRLMLRLYGLTIEFNISKELIELIRHLEKFKRANQRFSQTNFNYRNSELITEDTIMEDILKRALVLKNLEQIPEDWLDLIRPKLERLMNAYQTYRGYRQQGIKKQEADFALDIKPYANIIRESYSTHT